ncbi:MAG: hydroxyacid dehydrogenase [Candidatus Bipolaricaulota bacterium]|nr:MAG: hydroxyacid dehydrogenase [Candidatus Bipolaricaulota bacterium]
MTGTGPSGLRRVHFLHGVDDEAVLASLLEPSVRWTVGGSGDPVPADTEILVGGRPTAKELDASSALQVLLIPYAGVPASTRALLLERPQIRVHNLHHNAAAAAELALALFLAAAKRIIPADRSLRGGDWSIRYEDARELLIAGKTAVVLGFGAVGSLVARACCGLGMRVTAVRRRPVRGAGIANGIDLCVADELPRVLPTASGLFVCVPLTPATAGMIGHDELTLLPEDAVVVNIARGPIVEEKPLYDALAAGRIAAAGLDVWYRYPEDAASRGSTLPSAYPFHELDNVVLSPHRGGAFRQPELERTRLAHLARSINIAARGEAMPHRVNVDAGY